MNTVRVKWIRATLGAMAMGLVACASSGGANTFKPTLVQAALPGPEGGQLVLKVRGVRHQIPLAPKKDDFLKPGEPFWGSHYFQNWQWGAPGAAPTKTVGVEQEQRQIGGMLEGQDVAPTEESRVKQELLRMIEDLDVAPTTPTELFEFKLIGKKIDGRLAYDKPVVVINGAFARKVGIDPCEIDSWWTAGLAVDMRMRVGVQRYTQCADVRQAVYNAKNPLLSNLILDLCDPDKHTRITIDPASARVRVEYKGRLCTSRTDPLKDVDAQLEVVGKVTPWW
jgi:hypothetical protein